MKLVAGASLILAVALAACGTPSPREELQDWRAAADAACGKAERSIARRGAPSNGDELVRFSRQGAADALDAVREVLALEVPERSAPGVAMLRSVMQQAAEHLRALEQIGSLVDPRAAREVIDEVEDELDALSPAARTAGLRVCGRQEARDAAVDGLKAPLFEAEFDDWGSRLLEELGDIWKGSDGSAGDIEDALIAADVSLDQAREEFELLRPPRWAQAEVDAYKKAALRLQDAVERSRAAFSRGRGSRARAQAVGGLDRANRRHARAAFALVDSVHRRLNPGDDAPNRQDS